MNSVFSSVVLVIVLATSSFAQGLSANGSGESKPDKRTAHELFEDANGYLGRRYQEFNKQKLPYDPKLEAQTKKEQKELAVKNAATLQSRSPLKGDDIYYLGMLHHLAGDADAALTTMRVFLKEYPRSEGTGRPKHHRSLRRQKGLGARGESRGRGICAPPAAESRRSLSHGASNYRCSLASEGLRRNGHAREADARRGEDFR